jgi:S-formylglutathione hydrolase
MADAKDSKDLLLKQVSSSRCYGGVVKKFSHKSTSTKTDMKFSVFLPACAIEEPARKVPVIYWLSGLTCTEENFITKAGAQRTAARCNVALVCPDTSPRGANIAGEDQDYDFGTGAGFYINATRAPWSTNYRMYDYVVQELPAIVQKFLPVSDKKASNFNLVFSNCDC